LRITDSLQLMRVLLTNSATRGRFRGGTKQIYG